MIYTIKRRFKYLRFAKKDKRIIMENKLERFSIMLDDNYQLTVDDRNFIIKKRYINNKIDSSNYGTEYWEIEGFYGGRLDHALQAYARKTLLELNGTELGTIVEAIHDLDYRLTGLVKRFNLELTKFQK